MMFVRFFTKDTSSDENILGTILSIMKDFEGVFLAIGAMIVVKWRSSKIYERKIDILEKTYNDFVLIYNFIKNIRGKSIFQDNKTIEEVKEIREYAQDFLDDLCAPYINNLLSDFVAHKPLYKLRWGCLPPADEDDDVFSAVTVIKEKFKLSCYYKLTEDRAFAHCSKFFPHLPFESVDAEYEDIIMKQLQKIKETLENAYELC